MQTRFTPTKLPAGFRLNVKRDTFLITWLLAGLVLVLLLFATALQAQPGKERWTWIIGGGLFLLAQSFVELWILDRLYPDERDHNASWAMVLPVLALVWLVMQQLIAGSFSNSIG